jgi:GT2 family glycosyltransferase
VTAALVQPSETRNPGSEPAVAVSVVIPTYNRSQELARLLQALERCDRPPGGVEFIVVDDGSTDDTQGTIATSGLAGLTGVRKDNGGAASARNQGWRMARGDLIVFTDDDCVPTPRWLLELVDALSGESLAGIGGRVVPLVPGFIAEFVQAERLVGHGGDATNVKYLVTANAAYRRSVLEALGGFDERFPGAAGEDTDLTLRVLEHDLQLTLTDSATVAHDHRTSIRGLFRTYYRHGRAWTILAQAHPQQGLGTRSTSMATVRYWRNRYRYYQDEGASRGAASVYCGLRFAGLACYATGIMREELARRRAPRH